jgi:RNA polymerase sigma factor for flagellar operon FliA
VIHTKPEEHTMPDPKERLVQQHMSFAEALARDISKLLPAWVPFDDLRQGAFLGLIEASERFDPSVGTSFTTFAHPRIRGGVWDCVRKMRDIPPHLRNEARRQALFAAATEDVGAAIERSASDAQATAAHFRKAIDIAGAVVLMTDFAQAADHTTADHTAGSAESREPSYEPTESECERAETAEAVRTAIAALPAKLKVIVEAIVLEGRRQVDLAAERGCDKAVINRLWKEALRQMQPGLAVALGRAERVA